MRDPTVQKEMRLRRFPLRTLLLMILALAAFVRMWCATHPASEPRGKAVDVQLQR